MLIFKIKLNGLTSVKQKAIVCSGCDYDIDFILQLPKMCNNCLAPIPKTYAYLEILNNRYDYYLNEGIV